MTENAALPQLLDARDIYLGFAAGSVVEAIQRLLRPALTRRFHDPEVVNGIIDAVIKREEESPTMCGALALPHTREAGLDDFILSVGANPEGAIRGHQDPRLIVAFVSPQGNREQHLRLLASLAQLGQNRDVVDRIARASSADQVIDALRSAGV
jgi:mannitol/fructose-specific phosphotransferase system IIA component (Ntr-type)